MPRSYNDCAAEVMVVNNNSPRTKKPFPWITLDGNSCDQSEVLLSVLAVGLLEAVKTKSMSIKDSYDYLFNVKVLRFLEENESSDKLICLYDGCESLDSLQSNRDEEAFELLVDGFIKQFNEIIQEKAGFNGRGTSFCWLNRGQTSDENPA